MTDPITVRLVGGLGNQLFGYYAGAATAERLGVGLRLDTSRTRRGMSDHGLEILRLDLPGEWLLTRERTATPQGLLRTVDRVEERLTKSLPSLRRLRHIYQASTPGRDRQLIHVRPGTEIRGYFQSWEVVQEAVDRGLPRRPAMRSRSGWLEQMVERAARELPVAVHVRRGDYLKMSRFALLGPTYYEAAIDLVRREGVHGPIWLFSDDPKGSLAALGKHHSSVEVIQSPDGPATEMLVMSHAAANVIANSTFSWWGAWMNEDAQLVVAPNPWLPTGPNVEDIVPPRWRLQNY